MDYEKAVEEEKKEILDNIRFDNIFRVPKEGINS